MFRTWFNRYLVCPGAPQNPPFDMWWPEQVYVGVYCFFLVVVPGIGAMFFESLRQAWWFAGMGALLSGPEWFYLSPLIFSKAARRNVLWVRLGFECGLQLLMYSSGCAVVLWALERWFPVDPAMKMLYEF